MRGKRREYPPGQMRRVLAENLKAELEKAFPGSANLPLSFERRFDYPKENIRRYLVGEIAPNVDVLERIADCLKVQLYKLLVPSETMAKKFEPEMAGHLETDIRTLPPARQRVPKADILAKRRQRSKPAGRPEKRG